MHKNRILPDIKTEKNGRRLFQEHFSAKKPIQGTGNNFDIKAGPSRLSASSIIEILDVEL